MSTPTRPPLHLYPNLELLRQEYVLVQAWKKTVSHIRSHNWYADTLVLDRAAVNLPDFIHELGEQLQSPSQWINDPLRIVPAPKSQKWRVDATTNRWEPVNKGETARKLRPLAHASLKDQVAATALMLCLADRVETAQGDPTNSIESLQNRQAIISYGNRLFCNANNSELHHRWGSTKLYRGYFQDYRRFLSRPETVAEPLARDAKGNLGQNLGVVIVHSDLRQFYDRVRPELLTGKINALRKPGDDQAFFDMVRRILCWGWSDKDQHEVAEGCATVFFTCHWLRRQGQGVVAGRVSVEPVLPELRQAPTALDAAQGQDVLGPRLAPEHARLLAPRADHRFAARFDHPGADEQALPAEGAILHPRDVVDEVAQFLFDGGGAGGAGALPPGLRNQGLHLVAKESARPAAESFFVVGVLLVAQQRRQHLARVFERMIEVHDLEGLGKTEPSHPGQALRPVDEQHHLQGQGQAPAALPLN